MSINNHQTNNQYQNNRLNTIMPLSHSTSSLLLETDSNNSSKYNHLAFLQKKEQILSYPRSGLNLMPSISPTVPFAPSPYSPLPFVHTPNQLYAPNFNQMMITYPFPNSTTTSSNPNSFNSSSSFSFFAQSEQDVLDNGFMNLFQNDSNSEKKTSNTANKNLFSSSTSSINRNSNNFETRKKTGTNEFNLIDLESTFDLKNMSDIDIFDPLAQKTDSSDINQTQVIKDYIFNPYF